MKIINFSIEDDYGLVYNNELLDLHNCYEFQELKYSLNSKKIELEWDANDEWVVKTSIKKFKLTFNRPVFFKVRERNFELPKSEDLTLSRMGFIHPEDEDMDNPCELNDRKENFHMLFTFQGGMSIRIYAESVELIYQLKLV